MYLFFTRVLFILIVYFLTGCQTSLTTKDNKTNLTPIDHLLFSPDGRSLAYITKILNNGYDTDSRTIGLWGLNSGTVKNAGKAINHQIETLFFSPDGKNLALMYSAQYSSYGAKTNYGFIWHIGRNELSEKQSYMPSYLGPESIVAVSPDKKFTAQPNLDGRIRLWNNATKQIIKTYQFEHIKTLNAMQFTPDSQSLVIVGQYYSPPYSYYNSGKKNNYQGPTLAVSFDLSDKSENRVLDTHNSFLSYQKQSHRLITNSKGTVKIWNSFKQTLVQKIDYVGDMKQMQLSHDGRYLAAIIHSNLILLAEDKPIEMEIRGVIVIWDIKTALPIHVLTDGTDSTTSLAISSDNKTLATGDGKGVIRLWNMKTGKMIKHLAVHGLKQGKIDE